MANDKEVIKRLLKIADNQQKIITKLAQFADHSAPATEAPAPVSANTREAETILAALPAPVKAVVALLEVHTSRDPQFAGEVHVKFVPGKASDMAFKAIQKVVQDLGNRNLLPGAYMVKEV